VILLPLALASLAAVDSTASLRVAIEARIAQDSGAQVAVAFVDKLRSDSLFLSADTVFHAASTMKVPVMMELFRQAEVNGFDLDQQVLLINRFRSIADDSPFSIDPAEDSDTSLYSQLGKRVPVRELMQRMITRSSNLATNQIIEMIGADHVNTFMRRLGARRMTVLRGVEDLKAFDRGMINVATARDLAILMSAIHEGRAPNEAHSREMTDILLAQEFNEKIPAGLPSGTKVAHKTGEITAHSHDAAIVYPANRSGYVLVVLTRGIRDSRESSKLIADISRLVYQYASR